MDVHTLTEFAFELYNRLYMMYRGTFSITHRKVDGIEMNIKVPFSDIRNNNRDINF